MKRGAVRLSTTSRAGSGAQADEEARRREAGQKTKKEHRGQLRNSYSILSFSLLVSEPEFRLRVTNMEKKSRAKHDNQQLNLH